MDNSTVLKFKSVEFGNRTIWMRIQEIDPGLPKAEITCVEFQPRDTPQKESHTI